jgi:hypothetical protein
MMVQRNSSSFMPNKEELRDMISHGAHKIFTQQDATVEDIEVILKQSEELTQQLNATIE